MTPSLQGEKLGIWTNIAVQGGHTECNKSTPCSNCRFRARAYHHGHARMERYSVHLGARASLVVDELPHRRGLVHLCHSHIDHPSRSRPRVGFRGSYRLVTNMTSEVFRAFHGTVVDDKFVANTVTKRVRYERLKEHLTERLACGRFPLTPQILRLLDKLPAIRNCGCVSLQQGVTLSAVGCAGLHIVKTIIIMWGCTTMRREDRS